ncbi:MAG: tetratricopeptide repeat protein [Thermoanaerobaculia bacterium]|jgi:tetratricopeptide (TPR) repeat protein
MRIAAGILSLALVAIPPALQAWLRSSNSRASTEQGIEQYEKKKNAEATSSFAAAEQIDHGAIARYNLGTARVASGEGSRAATDFGDAIKDDTLAADAFYNRGSAALQSQSWDDAIRDFSDVLRRNPIDADAKRNLEIALRRKQKDEERRRQQQQQQQQQKQQGSDQKQQQPKAGDEGEKQPEGDVDLESLLRSVSQQEREELSRMRRSSAPRGRNW